MSDALLDLAQPRTIVLDGPRGRQYILRCRRIAEEDWLAYFKNITTTTEGAGRDISTVFEYATARLVLAEAVLESASGYKVAGGADLCALADWKKRVPLAHRQLLGETLCSVRQAKLGPEDELIIAPEGDPVLLDATWSGVEMQQFLGLKHILKTPSEEQYRRFHREASRTVVVGGSRTGKTIYPNVSELLAKLYDEMVMSVEGYAWNGMPIADRSGAADHMDMLHKVEAANAVFRPQDAIKLAGSGEEGEGVQS